MLLKPIKQTLAKNDEKKKRPPWHGKTRLSMLQNTGRPHSRIHQKVVKRQKAKDEL
jgi:hypothetical protein